MAAHPGVTVGVVSDFVAPEARNQVGMARLKHIRPEEAGRAAEVANMDLEPPGQILGRRQ